MVDFWIQIGFIVTTLGGVMAKPLSFEELAGAVQVMEQSDIVNGFFKDHVEGKRDDRKQRKISFIMKQKDVNVDSWANVTAALLYDEQLQDYAQDD